MLLQHGLELRTAPEHLVALRDELRHLAVPLSYTSFKLSPMPEERPLQSLAAAREVVALPCQLLRARLVLLLVLEMASF